MMHWLYSGVFHRMQKSKDWTIKKYETVTSTNDIAKESFCDENKIVIVAKKQLSGRGRRGNIWISQSDNLFFSMLFRADTDISNLTFVSSLSIAETISNISDNIKPEIKWPNDVLIENKKVSGILIEGLPEQRVIIGIGVNTNSHPNETDFEATNIASRTTKINNDVFLREYLQIFDKNYKLCLRDFGFIRQKWLKYATKLNQIIKVRRKNNAEEGIFRGIDEKGLLLLEQNKKIQKIAVAEVFL